VHVGGTCGLTWGGSMIDADPLFADAPGGDFHLTWDSPCRNTGDNSPYPNPSEDFEGEPRIADGTADLGADEFFTHLYCMGAVIPGSPIAIKVAGTPGVTPVRLALGRGIQDPPRPTPYGDLYLLLPPLYMMDMGTIPSNDVLSRTATVPLIWNSGDEKPFQALIGPPGSTTSELSNLMVLKIE
jgi:hypothetical protein